MNKTESILNPFEFDSPVEFVLIGVVGKGRAVVAKSKGAQLDLIAYAQRKDGDKDETSFPLQLFPFPTLIQLQPFFVDSLPTNFHSNHAYDNRMSKWTLVWRGSGYRQDKKNIKEEFQKGINSIIEALEKKSAAQLEWAMSPVIDQCHKATIYSRGKRNRFVYAFWFTMLVYFLGIATFLITRFVLK